MTIKIAILSHRHLHEASFDYSLLLDAAILILQCHVHHRISSLKQDVEEKSVNSRALKIKRRKVECVRHSVS